MAPPTFERVFLDWHGAMLPAAARWLCATYGAGDTVDLGHMVVAVTGRRAGRRLLELIVASAQDQRLVPPLIVTAGGLADHLLPPDLPMISELESRLERVKQLRAAPRPRIEPLVGPRPDDADFRRWLDAAEQWRTLHETLAAEGLRPSDVLRRAGDLLPPEAIDRWEALEVLQTAYEETLRSVGRRDRHMARWESLDTVGKEEGPPIVLVGTVDLNRITRRILEARGGTVTALVHAPDAMGDAFDAMGCLDIPTWAHGTIDLSEATVRVVDGWTDQPATALSCLAETTSEQDLTLDDVTLGLGDPELEPHLQRRFHHAEIPVHRPTGIPMQATAPCRLLHALADWVESRQLSDLSTLLRHPHVAAWCAARDEAGVSASESPVTMLDCYQAEHLQGEAGAPWRGADGDRVAALTSLIDGLAPAGLRERRGPADWAAALLQILGTLYGDMRLTRHAPGDHDTIQSLEALAATLDRITAAAPIADHPPLALRDAMDLIHRDLPDATAPTEGNTPAIELLGWLELHADDAPHLFVLGFNEGNVPAARGVDPWLPNRLRTKLALPDDARRLARDTYLLTAKLRSCESVTLIGSRHGHDHEPIPPSRLLLTGDAATVALRLKHCCHPEDAPPSRAVAPHTGDRRRFRVPRPAARPEAVARFLARVPVTALKAYVACPYRFYLRHVEGLKPAPIDEGELGPLAFGSLLHDVLCAFGADSDLQANTDPQRLEAWLHHQLDDEVERRFGDRVHAAVSIQAAFAKDRLSDFAQWQAGSATAGWRIVETERSLMLPLGDRATLVGRVDRIDRHDEHGLRIIDYKTGDAPADPRHHRSGRGEASRWVDFQLPCYRKMVEAAGITTAPEPVTVGYIVLPRERGAVEFLTARWSANDFEEAIDAAETVIGKIRDGIFWPPSPASSPWDPYARLCGEGVFDQKTLLDEPHDVEEGARP